MEDKGSKVVTKNVCMRLYVCLAIFMQKEKKTNKNKSEMFAGCLTKKRGSCNFLCQSVHPILHESTYDFTHRHTQYATSVLYIIHQLPSPFTSVQDNKKYCL